MMSKPMMVENGSAINEIRETLVEHLILYYPDGSSSNEDQIQQWMTEIAHHYNIVDDSNDNENDNNGSRQAENIRMPDQSVPRSLVQQAIKEAVQQWRSDEFRAAHQSTKLASSKSAKSSFSLLDQLQGGFGPIVRLENITQASGKERLQLLEKMFLDDVVPEWEQLRPLICAGIEQTDANNQALQYIQILRSWFDQGRKSSEFLSLQYDLCFIMLDTAAAIVKHPTSAIESNGHLICLLKTWNDMWVDLMQRDVYSESGTKVMESAMLSLWTCHQDQQPADQILSAHLLAMIDTKADWFDSWSRHVSCDRLVQLLEENPQFLPTIGRRCSQFGKRTLTESDVGRRALQMQSLSILRSILVNLRVSRFPWQMLPSSDGSSIASKMSATLKLFLTSLASWNGRDEFWGVMFGDAISSILEGSKTKESLEAEIREALPTEKLRYVQVL